MTDDYGEECQGEVERLRKENADLKHFIAQIPWREIEQGMLALWYRAQFKPDDAIAAMPGDKEDSDTLETWLAHAHPRKERSE